MDFCTDRNMCFACFPSCEEEKTWHKKLNEYNLSSDKVWRKKERWEAAFFFFFFCISTFLCVWGCVCWSMCITPCILKCVKTVQLSHPAHTASGLYPSNWRSQSDIVLLWLLSMVLHISSEMTKSFNQRPWPLASLLVLPHSHSLMWHWIGIGHRPHSRDWYHLCCSPAYGSGRALRSAAVCLILCSFFYSGTEMSRITCAIALKQKLPFFHRLFVQDQEKKICNLHRMS